MVSASCLSPWISGFARSSWRTHIHNQCRPMWLPLSLPTNRNKWNELRRGSRMTVLSAKEEEDDPSIPSRAKPDSDEPPPWARNEAESQKSSFSFDFPSYFYLLASTITAIAAIGSVFEYVNQRPVFGVLSSDSVFYAPLLGFFAFTGAPAAGFLWYKSVQIANKEADEQDRRDGYL